MGLTVVAEPAEEPVSVAEAKSDLEVTHSDDDSDIALLITAARRAVEKGTRRALIEQTLEYSIDRFPSEIILPRPPVAAIVSIVYTDSDGADQPLDSSLYQVDLTSDRVRICPAFDESWPETRRQYSAVRVRYTAGYGAAATDVPADLRKAILLLVNHWYENREAVIAGTSVSEVPMSAQWLIDMHRVYGICEL